MNTKLSKRVLAMGALVMAGGAMGQSTATETDGTAVANATVIAPITIAENLSLEFGAIVAGEGTVIVGTDGGRTDSAAALTPGANQQGTIRAATFKVTGQGEYTYAITLPANDVVILTSGEAEPIVVNDFTVDAGTAGAVAGAVGILAAGDGNLNVGATLTVPALQAAGAYTGAYTVTIAYN